MKPPASPPLPQVPAAPPPPPMFGWQGSGQTKPQPKTMQTTFLGAQDTPTQRQLGTKTLLGT